MSIDSTTKSWIRNASDERAASRGYRVDESRGELVLNFARDVLKLYEGETAGQPLEPMDWQIEVCMRLFGWVKHSDRWGREIRRFRKAGIFLPKKNGKSPALAWWALYLLCADGEMGQKVYLGAKDGQQSREIAGKHCLEMVRSSPELLAVCDVNLSLMQITHRPTKSILKPISSTDSRAQKSKEGLNGSLLIDETHVVDAAFMSRVSRAGISRSEPLQIEVSTAGDDPEGYGKQSWDYGRKVESGEEDNDTYFFLAYAAPQDLSDEDLAADPVKYGKMANPAWGVTVGEEEYLNDYRESRGSMTNLADFKKYRLNIWQKAELVWLPVGAWEKNQLDFTEADLAGRVCYGGLDLAKVLDTTALALVFPWDDGTYRLIVKYWLPEATARKLSRKVRYEEWARDGWVTLTQGVATDYNFVRQQINATRKMYDLRKLAFDGTYAEQMLQRLVEEDGMDIQTQFPFRQAIMEFANPTAAFERAVLEGKLNPNRNPLLAWQAGHTTVRSDVNQNKRPVKQRHHGDIRTIDGVVASIMALGTCQKFEQKSQPSIVII